jgi:hypothetical protein
MKKVIAGLALVIGTSHAAWAVDCSSFPNNTVTGFVNEDVTAFNISCTIARNASVNGNVLQVGNGSLTIRGVVNGGVEESGAGGITLLAGARVNGDLSELDGGNIVIRGGTTLGGLVSEAGAGSVSVTVDLPGLIKGDINEAGLGSVFITTINGDFEGNVIEADGGDVDVSVAAGTFFKGGIEEELAGSVVVDVDGRFEGNLVERGAGNLTTAGSGTVAGNSEHELPGTCSNTVRDFQGAICNLL